jgi:hypothetical protein
MVFSVISSTVSTTRSMALGGIFLAPGSRKRDAVESLIMKRGTAAGFGGGFVSGAMMNWRSTINVLGPSVFGGMYAYGEIHRIAYFPRKPDTQIRGANGTNI